MSEPPLNYAERAVLLERIETLEADLLVERALNHNLQTAVDALMAELEHVRQRIKAVLAEPEQLSIKQGRRFEIDPVFRVWVE